MLIQRGGQRRPGELRIVGRELQRIAIELDGSELGAIGRIGTGDLAIQAADPAAIEEIRSAEILGRKIVDGDRARPDAEFPGMCAT